MTALLAARDVIVREHMESENRHDFEATLATFDNPRYELVGTGDIHDAPSSDSSASPTIPSRSAAASPPPSTTP